MKPSEANAIEYSDLLDYIQIREDVTRAEIAQRLEVSTQTLSARANGRLSIRHEAMLALRLLSLVGMLGASAPRLTMPVAKVTTPCSCKACREFVAHDARETALARRSREAQRAGDFDAAASLDQQRARELRAMGRCLEACSASLDSEA